MSDYIIDVLCNKKTNIEQVKEIQEKVLCHEKINTNEEKELLKYIVLETRKKVSNDIDQESFENKCDLCQMIICNYLDELGVINHPNMTINSISKDVVGHSFVVATFNQVDYWLVDPTYKQFLRKDKCCKEHEVVIKEKRAISPDPGFYIKAKNKKIFEDLLRDGFIPLNDETAKAYGDSFYYTKTNIETNYTFPNITGSIYSKSFKKGNERLSVYDIEGIKL